MIQDQTFLSKILEDKTLDFDCIYFNGWNDFDYWANGEEFNALFQFDKNKIINIRDVNMWTIHRHKFNGIFQK